LRATLMYNHYPTINGNRSINRKSRPFGVEDRAPCPSCGAEMNLYGRSPEPVHHGYEVQMFSCMECDAVIRSADRTGKPHPMPLIIELETLSPSIARAVG